MAFQALVSGSAQCGPSNPLQNLLRHTDQDAHFSRFTQVPQAPQSHFRNLGRGAPSSIKPDVPLESAPDVFNMDSVQRELGHVDLMDRSFGTAHAQGWRSQYLCSSNHSPSSHTAQLLRMQPRLGSPSLQADFASFMSNSSSSSDLRASRNDQPGNAAPDPGSVLKLTPGERLHHPLLGQQGLYRLQMGGQWSSLGPSVEPWTPTRGLLNNPPLQPPDAKLANEGAQQLVELTEEDWEVEFAKIGDELDSHVDECRLPGAIADSAIGQSSAMESDQTFHSPLDLASSSGQLDAELDEEFLKSLETTWRNLASSLNASSLTDPELDTWSREFQESLSHLPPPTSNFMAHDVDDFVKNPTPFPFQDNNPYATHPDPFQEGQRLLASGAPLSQAARAFEAACRLNTQRGEAWRMLGETHAADEKEQLAIKAFEKAVCCGGPDGQAAWMSLAVCWVNEGQEMKAFAILEKWLHDTYPSVSGADTSSDRLEPANPWSRHSAVVNKFISAARAGPLAREGIGKEGVQGQMVDSDVQVGLGVLFFSNSDFERAKDCFEAALDVKPDDFLLWNRLGATLSNGGQSEQAIGAYRKALELRPTFTRAIYNMGVSCMNIHCYKEAAEHILAALSLHQDPSSSQNTSDSSSSDALLSGSDNLWYTLRRAFLCLEREDLAERACPTANVDSFRADGFDF